MSRPQTLDFKETKIILFFTPKAVITVYTVPEIHADCLQINSFPIKLPVNIQSLKNADEICKSDLLCQF